MQFVKIFRKRMVCDNEVESQLNDYLIDNPNYSLVKAEFQRDGGQSCGETLIATLELNMSNEPKGKRKTTNAEKFAQELAQDTDKMAYLLTAMDCGDCPASDYCAKRMEELIPKGYYLRCYEIVKEWLDTEVDENDV